MNPMTMIMFQGKLIEGRLKAREHLHDFDKLLPANCPRTLFEIADIIKNVDDSYATTFLAMEGGILVMLSRPFIKAMNELPPQPHYLGRPLNEYWGNVVLFLTGNIHGVDFIESSEYCELIGDERLDYIRVMTKNHLMMWCSGTPTVKYYRMLLEELRDHINDIVRAAGKQRVVIL